MTMPKIEKYLNRIQLQAVALTVEGYSVAEVAQILGKGERTIERWRALAAFKNALAEARRSGQKKS
jgi:transposase